MVDTGQAGAAVLQKVRGGGPAQHIVTIMAELRKRWDAMPAGRRGWALASVAFLAAMVAAMLWSAEKTDWRILFSNLDNKDVQQVSQELAAAKIPFEIMPDGAGVEVPAESLDKARMEVAAKGMPQTGRMGFELFDKPNWVGSEFDEKVNYQRALEGELEHTIGTLSAVRSARVHLVLPKQSLFAAEDRPAKASVVLKLRRSSMDKEQADSIRSLIAGAVENLTPDQVALVDADGRVTFKAASEDATEANEEHAIEASLISMLEPLAGQDNVRAVVTVSKDDSSEERTDEVYDPSQIATLSMQRSEQTSAAGARAQGVPGTASNSPAAAPAGAVQGSQAAAAPGTPPLLQKEVLPVYPGGGVQGQVLKEENGQYAITKHTTHIEQRPGRVRRITAAVVVNDRAAMEGSGKLQHVVWRPRSAEEMRRLEQLAQAAVGFDGRRGDQVTIENVSFESNDSEVQPQGMDAAMEQVRELLRSQPALLHTLLIGLCGVLLVLFAIYPLSKQMIATLQEMPSLPRGQEGSGAAPGNQLMENGEGATYALPRELTEAEEERLRDGPERQGLFEQVAEHIRREPIQSTKLLEAWIAAPEALE